MPKLEFIDYSITSLLKLYQRRKEQGFLNLASFILQILVSVKKITTGNIIKKNSPSTTLALYYLLIMYNCTWKIMFVKSKAYKVYGSARWKMNYVFSEVKYHTMSIKSPVPFWYILSMILDSLFIWRFLTITCTFLVAIVNLWGNVSICTSNIWEIFDHRSLLQNIFLISAKLNLLLICWHIGLIASKRPRNPLWFSIKSIFKFLGKICLHLRFRSNSLNCWTGKFWQGFCMQFLTSSATLQ